MVFREFTSINGNQTPSTKPIKLTIQATSLICNKTKYCKRTHCKMRVSLEPEKNSWEPPKEEWPRKQSESYTIGSYNVQCKDGLASSSKKKVRNNNFKGPLLKWERDYLRMHSINICSSSSGAGNTM